MASPMTAAAIQRENNIFQSNKKTIKQLKF